MVQNQATLAQGVASPVPFQVARPQVVRRSTKSHAARASAPLFAPTIRAMTQSLELLVKTAMPFGKYKGTLLVDLPGDYLNWFAREGFPPGQLGRLLALMHEIDHNGLKHLLKPLRTR
jgi:uncharacterized protein